MAIILGANSSSPADASTTANFHAYSIAGGNIPVQPYQLISQPDGIALIASELVNFAGNIGISAWLSDEIDSFAAQIPARQDGQRPVPADFFGSAPVPFSANATRQKWNRVRASLDNYSNVGCKGMSSCGARVAMMREVVGNDRASGLFGKLETVNATVNAMIRYTPDASLNGKIDHWADPAETIRTGTGDCEDYAILKLAALKDLGVPMQSMSIIILRDTRRNLYHAVLAVTTNRGHLILDNMRNRVFRDTAFTDYKPLYSFSGDRSWIHGTRTRTVLASADSNHPGSPLPMPANVDRSIKTASIEPNSFDDLRAVPVK